MKFEDFAQAKEDAEHTMRLADRMANDIAKLLRGRLRKVNDYHVLADLKRELKDYNSHTRRS